MQVLEGLKEEGKRSESHILPSKTLHDQPSDQLEAVEVPFVALWLTHWM